jgi:hypothetical protein
LVKRQPTVESAISGARRLHGTPDLSITYGARVIDSTPPATKVAPSPALMAWAALATACRPEPQSRLIVCPGTSTGRPASRAAIRATLRLSSPAWLAQPRITSSIAAGSSAGCRCRRARIGSAARSSVRTPRNTAVAADGVRMHRR